MGDSDVDEGMALKYVFKKWDMRERTWILVAQNTVPWQASCSKDGNEILNSIKQETFVFTEQMLAFQR
jgi:hypothetical protein